jgi:hypothetical protein
MGIREPQHIGQEFAQNAAAYLGVPAVLVKLLAGRLTLGDFAWPQSSQEKDIADGLTALRDDPVLGALVPDVLYQAAPAVQGVRVGAVRGVRRAAPSSSASTAPQARLPAARCVVRSRLRGRARQAS